MRVLLFMLVVLFAGCDAMSGSGGTGDFAVELDKTLPQARQGFETKIIGRGDNVGRPDVPVGGDFEMIQYSSPVGKLAAYVTTDPGNGEKHPAIVWITGGDNNSIGDVWSPSGRENDQSATAFRKSGIVMMFPSQRGGNNNPGQREGFYGEVDDVIAATKHLAALPYVDPDNIYLGGHSTGGTMVLLVAACSDQYRAVFSLGPVATPAQYGGDYLYCDINNEQEVYLRSPICWQHSIKNPTFVFEGAVDGNWEAVEMLKAESQNPKIQYFKVPGKDHFSAIAPVAEMLAEQIINGNVEVNQQMIQSLK